ncbi:MAG: sigma-70 family RNA polymerase sigma factor [Planctomycetota bacterium]
MFTDYALARFDLECPDRAILPPVPLPLKTETMQQIFQQHRRGDSAESLAQRYCMTSTRICSVIRGMRAAWIMELPLNCMGSEQFARLRSKKREREILQPPPEGDLAIKTLHVPSGVPGYLASLHDVPLLTQEQETHLFRKLNYLKYKASRLRDTLDVDRPERCLMNQIEILYDELVATKNQIIRSNLRLVVSIAKRYVGSAVDFFELVSDGNISLMRAVEKFDVSRGNRFSTYASWAIMKNYARTISDLLRRQGRFRTNHSETFDTVEDDCVDQSELESAQIQRGSHVEKILKQLDERERQIVTLRFGLTRGQKPLTLKQVGVTMGVSKERVRQILCRAMGKLKRLLRNTKSSSPYEE